MNTRALLAVAAVSAAALVLPPTAGATARLGIADQKTDMFADARFLALGLEHARLAVPWDVLERDFTLAEADAWLSAARAEGIRPLVTFQKSRVVKRAPAVSEYRTAFRKFRARYPWIQDFSAWNEPQIEPPRSTATEVGYFLAMRDTCPRCTVLGADLLDTPSVARYVRAFIKLAGRRAPKAWGMHNYVTANRRSKKAVNAVLRASRPAKLWLTETGGLVARRNNSTIELPEGTDHAARTTEFILRSWGDHPRIPFLFLYHWNSRSATDSWDSAFVGPDGVARPSLEILSDFINR